MNRNDFINMIVDTVPINRQMIGEVYELIDIFPYFQSAHMLLLKGLQNNADVKFENQLKISAIHIADREVLYYLLKEKPPVEVTSDEPRLVNNQPENLQSNTQQTVIESAKNSEGLISEIEKNTAEIKSEEQSDAEHQTPAHSILIISESDDEESSGVMLIMDEESSPYEEKIFYMDPGFSAPERVDLLELDLDENNTSISDETVTDKEQVEHVEKESVKRLQTELIDRFIIADPRIEAPKDKTNMPLEDISRPSVEEEGGLVTETLAKIYCSQGYYSKAIDIYEKLSLKFPEKSSYFASQIEKVKEYIKN